MRRYLAFAIILSVFISAIAAGVLLFHFRRPSSSPSDSIANPGAQPPHIRGIATAPVTLEEFGDFECLPCFLLWPALRNLEHDYGKSLSVTFRQNPLPQHHQALDGARASEAAGLQGQFWEMHDLLYLSRSSWVRSEQPRARFNEFAARLGLDVDRFNEDMDEDEVAKRITADRERGAALGIDRTPAVFINGRRVQLQPDVEKGLREDIDAALGAKRQ